MSEVEHLKKLSDVSNGSNNNFDINSLHQQIVSLEEEKNALLDYIEEKETGAKKTRKQEVIEKLYDLGLNENYWPALKYLIDRIDGMPKTFAEIKTDNPQMDAILDAVRNGILEDD